MHHEMKASDSSSLEAWLRLENQLLPGGNVWVQCSLFLIGEAVNFEPVKGDQLFHLADHDDGIQMSYS